MHILNPKIPMCSTYYFSHKNLFRATHHPSKGREEVRVGPIKYQYRLIYQYRPIYWYWPIYRYRSIYRFGRNGKSMLTNMVKSKIFYKEINSQKCNIRPFFWKNFSGFLFNIFYSKIKV